MDSVAVGVIAVVPTDGFDFGTAVLADGHAVAAGVDAVIVPKFLELPEHFGARQ